MSRCGIFDSGIGGISVAKEIIKSGIFNEIVYFGDTARVPYGNKNETTIIRYSLEAVEFLKNFDIDFLVIACNTVSAVAIEEIKKETNFPVVGVIEAGIEDIKNQNRDSTILLIATKRTIASNSYQTLLKKEGFKNIISIPTPLFVPLVEEGIFEGKILDDVFELYFSDINRESIDNLILGCTHYPFLEKSFSKYFFNANIIHSGNAIVKVLRNKYKLTSKFNTSYKFFASDGVEDFRKEAIKLLQLS